MECGLRDAINFLEDELRRANFWYKTYGTSLMSDETYDTTCRKLVLLYRRVHRGTPRTSFLRRSYSRDWQLNGRQATWWC